MQLIITNFETGRRLRFALCSPILTVFIRRNGLRNAIGHKFCQNLFKSSYRNSVVLSSSARSRTTETVWRFFEPFNDNRRPILLPNSSNQRCCLQRSNKSFS